MNTQITCRIASEKDASSIVKMFVSDGNPYNWSVEKWVHYYRDYPLRTPYGVIAEDLNTVVGFTGMLPVKINQFNVMQILHTYVHKKYRNLKVITSIYELVDQMCVDQKVDFICGFPNRRFAEVEKLAFGRQIVGSLEFVNLKEIDTSDYSGRYRFCHNNEWYQWKFGKDKDIYIKDYYKDERVYHQLLKTKGDFVICADDHGYSFLNCWQPSRYQSNKAEAWCQIFVVKILNHCVPNEILNIDNWYIEMGDSDAFEYENL